MKVDTQYLRFLYEYRGFEISELAERYKLSEKRLIRCSIKEKWDRRNILTPLMNVCQKLETSLENAVSDGVESRNFKDITAALKETLAIKRDLYGFPTLEKQRDYELAKGKLELENRKLCSAQSPGVIRIELDAGEFSE